jgi:hypothetical protein
MKERFPQWQASNTSGPRRGVDVEPHTTRTRRHVASRPQFPRKLSIHGLRYCAFAPQYEQSAASHASLCTWLKPSLWRPG